MSYCSRPAKTSKTNFGTAATKTVNAPAPRVESCAPSESTVVSGGGTSTTTTVTVAGPAGPAGPAGANGTNGTNGIDGADAFGFLWKGDWSLGVDYYRQSTANPLASVVYYNGSTWVAVADNISYSAESAEFAPFDGSAAWQLMSQGGSSDGSIDAPGFDFFNMQDYVDWFKKASVTDLLLVGAALAGIIVAGSIINDMLTADGVGDGNADVRYTGTNGYPTGSFTTPKLPAVLTSLCAVAGKTADVSLVASVDCEFTIGNSNAVSNILKTLSLVYGLDMVDTGTTVKFVPRSATPVVTISDDDLGFSDGDMPLTRFAASRVQGITLPRTVTLKYSSRALDYNPFTQSAEIYTFAEGQDVVIDAPLTLSDSFAKEVAELSLLNAHLERQQYIFTLSYKYLFLECGDIFNTSKGLMRVRKVTEMRDGLLEISCVEAGGEIAIVGSGADAQIPPISSNVPVVIGYSQGLGMDIPVMSPSDTTPRGYLAIHGYDANGWPGASVYVSKTGASYDFAGSHYQEATVGKVAAVIPSSDYTSWDETTTISVTLKTNDLASKSMLDVLNGKNWAVIGKEVIGFRNAVLTGVKTYTLSGLLRGRNGTEQYVGTHVADELFTVLDDGLFYIDLDPAERGQTFKVKVVTIGSSLDQVSAVDVQWASNNTIPWTPVNSKLLKIGADYQFSWGERARFDGGMRDGPSSGRDSDWGGSTIIIYETDGVTIKKTYNTTSYVFNYTSAMQTADWGAPQSTIKAAVAQYSQTYGVGYPVSLTA